MADDTNTDTEMEERWYGKKEDSSTDQSDDTASRWYGYSDEHENAKHDTDDGRDGAENGDTESKESGSDDSEENVSQTADELREALEIDVDSKAGSSFVEFAAEAGLNADQAKQLAEVELDHRAEYWEKQEADWRKSSEADPIIGSRLPAIRDMVREYGDDNLVAELGAYSSHPGLLRFLANIADELDR